MTNPTTEAPSGKLLIRSRSVLRLHWFNAVCWFLLTASGLGIIRGEEIRILPAGWSEFLQNLVGGNANLALTHSVLGLLWAGVFLIFTIMNLRSVVLPFLRRVLTLTPKAVLTDLWSMTVTLAQLFGLLKNVTPPPAGRYNGAQRLLGTMILGCSLLVVLTGCLMWFGPGLGIAPPLFRWALVLHAACVGLVWIGLVAHIYFGAIEEPEALEGMKTGYMDIAYIKHHNPAWYDELKQNGQV